jgi:hypothetical protein
MRSPSTSHWTSVSLARNVSHSGGSASGPAPWRWGGLAWIRAPQPRRMTLWGTRVTATSQRAESRPPRPDGSRLSRSHARRNNQGSGNRRGSRGSMSEMRTALSDHNPKSIRPQHKRVRQRNPKNRRRVFGLNRPTAVLSGRETLADTSPLRTVPIRRPLLLGWARW